jgi:mannitol/fructose-specific phosphotransferase system IIA component (Ntr-type)
LARAVQPVFFGEADGLPTDIFFLIASTDSDLHIKMLARICRLCELTNFLTDLRAAESSEEMLDALRHAEAHPAFLKDLQ